MTESKPSCSLCYWWDAAPRERANGYRGKSNYHDCHCPDWPGRASAHDFVCDDFRPISPDDGTVLWRRGNPGHKKRKPKDPAAVKRGRASKKKGKRGEDEWAKKVVGRIGGNQIWEHGDRDPQWENNGLAGIRNEVKRYARFGFTKHCRQVMAKAAARGLNRWLVAWRPDCEPGERVQWFVTTDGDDFLDDMDELRDLRTIVDALKSEEALNEDAER